MKKGFSQLQRIGKALMLPIAVLPVAALMLRFGVDPFNFPFLAAAGSAIFDNLALLFAIGVAVGIAFDKSGAAGLAGAVGYLIITNATQAINPDINMGVLAGIIGGLVAGALYNRYHDIKLPDYLGFFGGRRFVPIVTGAACIVLAYLFGYVWPPIQNVINAAGQWAIDAGAIGVGVYGFLNRLLIPVGLHHVLNTLVWFVFGEFTTAAGEVVTGDLHRFFAGDPSAGIFMAGFFPMMMFGLPAAALAMYRAAKPKYRKAVSGIFISVALTSFLTGITEPIEFSFMFLAPLLYLIHAILSGGFLIVAYLLGIRHGFGFSAGLIDYVVNFNLAERPLLIILLGIGAFILYYIVFEFAIEKFNIATPGRLDADAAGAFDILPESQRKDNGKNKAVPAGEVDEKIEKFIEYLGGVENINKLDSCITRLRLEVNDTDKIDEAKLKNIGVTGVLKANKNNAQVVVGTQAELIADQINKALK
ncbi:MAG: PTS sugar transporter [Firmicutes bacterium]|nr:PTS sugar transporter [Bacillota bacterium]